MKKNYISKPKCIDKTIKFSDLSTISDFALNMVVEKKLSSLNMGLEVHNSYLYKIISYYNVSGETFVYFENGSLCRIINNTIIEFITCNCVPLLVEVIYEGERVPAAITDKGLYLLKSGLQRFSMPYYYLFNLLKKIYFNIKIKRTNYYILLILASFNL